MLGDEILVAPVLEEGQAARNIYLPEGKWIDQKDGTIHQGPMWLNNYEAPIDVLPYFIKSGSERLVVVNSFVIVGFITFIFRTYFM